MSRKNNRKNPDQETDFMYSYFMNEDKINDQLRPELDKEFEKKIENIEPNLDSRVLEDITDSETQEEELPSISTESEVKIRDNVDFGSESVSSNRSVYGKKIEPNTNNVKNSFYNEYYKKAKTADKEKTDNKRATENSKTVPKKRETKEEYRIRQRDNLAKLEELVEKYGVELSRDFFIDDDPDVMEEEYLKHKNKRAKDNQVRFYRRLLLNIICGVEFLNDKYNPFEFKLKDWSKQISSEMDEYTEILEEIYDKYKGTGSGMAPEIRLIVLLIMSGVTYHISQAMFSNGGLEHILQNNPSFLNKAVMSMARGGMNMLNKNDDEPTIEPKKLKPNTKNLLDRLKNASARTPSKDVSTSKSATDTVTNHTETTVSNNTEYDNRLISEQKKIIEQQRRMIEEQNKQFEEKMKQQNDIYVSRLQSIQEKTDAKTATRSDTRTDPRTDLQTATRSDLKQYNRSTEKYPTRQTSHRSDSNTITPYRQSNIILSDAKTRPRFLDDPVLSAGNYPKPVQLINFDDIFCSDQHKTDDNKIKKYQTESQNKNSNLNDILESLEKSDDFKLNKMTATTPNNKFRKQQTTSSKKPRNRPLRSISKKNNKTKIVKI